MCWSIKCRWCFDVILQTINRPRDDNVRHWTILSLVANQITFCFECELVSIQFCRCFCNEDNEKRRADDSRGHKWIDGNTITTNWCHSNEFRSSVHESHFDIRSLQNIDWHREWGKENCPRTLAQTQSEWSVTSIFFFF